jgi:hypothetical protein
MILDEQLPAFDVAIAAHLVVDALPASTWRATRELDFMSVHSPLMDASMWVRGVPGRLRGHQPPPPAELRLAEGGGLPGWLLLGEREGAEIAFGAVGVFWQPSIRWHDVERADFAGFAEPGYGKIGCNFTVRDYGAGRSLLSYECRVAITDAASRRKFARYWWVIRPFVAHIMRATLATIAAQAGRRPAAVRPATPVS